MIVKENTSWKHKNIAQSKKTVAGKLQTVFNLSWQHFECIIATKKQFEENHVLVFVVYSHKNFSSIQWFGSLCQRTRKYNSGKNQIKANKSPRNLFWRKGITESCFSTKSCFPESYFPLLNIIDWTRYLRGGGMNSHRTQLIHKCTSSTSFKCRLRRRYLLWFSTSRIKSESSEITPYFTSGAAIDVHPLLGWPVAIFGTVHTIALGLVLSKSVRLRPPIYPADRFSPRHRS